MTSEQIAELREILRIEFMPVWGTTDGRVVTWKTTPDVSKLVALALNALPRLLDERDALLKALHGAFDALEIAGEGRFHQDALQAAGAAIVKAESP